MLTVIDAVFLQRKNSLFTGGFLSVDHLKGPAEIVVFLAGSLLVDMAAVSLPLVLSLWLAGRLGLARWARRSFAAGVAVSPFLVVDIVSYQVFDHLGDAFDFGLMFDLVGRRPEEIWAVAGGHVAPALVLLSASGLGLLAVVWGLQRLSSSGAWPAAIARVHPRQLVLLLVGAGCLGLLVSTGLRLDRRSFDNGLRRKPSGRMFDAVVAWASDVDRDGYGVLSRPPDPAAFDARVHPYALDQPGNGVDENGLAGDLPADLAPYSEPAAATPNFVRKPTVVLVVLETFRADAVGMVMNGREVTPALNALAKAGVSSARAFSHNGYTVQSRYHLFAGSLAGLRGATTLIDDFKANGYEVAYFSGQDESFGGEDVAVGADRSDVFYDARQDYDLRYTTFATAGSLAVPHSVLNQRIQEFLTTRDRSRPLFLYVNFHDAHFPYHHAGIVPLVSPIVVAREDIGPERAADLKAMYYNTTSNVDRAVGELLGNVRAAVGEVPAVVVTADHGESVYDEGFLGHGYALNDEQTRIPLIASGLPVRVREPWGQSDLRDMVVEALSDPQRRAAVVEDGARSVFQYLGYIDRPAEIAFATMQGRMIYDLRSDIVRPIDGTAQRPRALDVGTRNSWLGLINFWERLQLARVSRRSAAGAAR